MRQLVFRTHQMTLSTRNRKKACLPRLLPRQPMLVVWKRTLEMRHGKPVKLSALLSLLKNLQTMKLHGHASRTLKWVELLLYLRVYQAMLLSQGRKFNLLRDGLVQGHRIATHSLPSHECHRYQSHLLYLDHLQCRPQRQYRSHPQRRLLRLLYSCLGCHSLRLLLSHQSYDHQHRNARLQGYSTQSHHGRWITLGHQRHHSA